LDYDGATDEQLAGGLPEAERRPNRAGAARQDSPEISAPFQENDARFLRTKGRTPVRRGAMHGRARSVLLLVATLGTLAAAGAGLWQARAFLLHDPRFKLPDTDAIVVQGNAAVAAADVQRIFAPDTGRSIFAVPLAERKAQIEQIAWVRSATVMRLWPDQLRVSLVERTPVAYVREGGNTHLTDAEGVLLPAPDGAWQPGSYPVVRGAWAGDAAARTHLLRPYLECMAALDANGNHNSQQVSEVDICDPEDVRIVVAGGEGGILVHLGHEKFLPRYQAFAAHLEEWLRMYPHLASVDMRYGRQVVLDMTPGNTAQTGTQTVPQTGTQTGPQAKPATQDPAQTEVQ
jgi:cell division protein FtsQ